LDRDREGEASDDQDVDFLEADLPEGGAALKRKSKKMLKDANGYGSDSSNDDEGVVPSRRADAKADEGGDGDEDEDMDMFADEPETKTVDEDVNGGKGKGKGKGKEKEFLGMEDIEGQEFDGKDRAGATDDDEDEGDEEDLSGSEMEDDGGDVRIGRKKAKEKDLGFEVTPFNMKAEMDEGRFTADGEEYVANEGDQMINTMSG
jgi:CD2 antigen cytoplasmic tail-binding protein 2